MRTMRIGFLCRGALGLCLTVLAGALCASCASMPGAGSAAAPASCELEYATSDTIRDVFGYVGSRSFEMSTRPRDKLEGEPVYFSKRPQYGSIQLGGLDEENEGKAHAFVLDESRGTVTGYETLYVDTDGDGSLDDEAGVTGEPNTYTRDGNEVKDWRRIDFPPVELQIAYGETTYPYHVKPHCYTYSETRISLRSSGYRKGDLTLGDETFPVALVDDTCNGRFNDPYALSENSSRASGRIYASGDALAIDRNRDGKFDKDYAPSLEAYRLGRHLVFDGVCYDVDVSPCGSRLALKPTESPCGKVTFSQQDCEVELVNEDGMLKVDGNLPTTRIPVGEYRFASCRFEQTTAGGKIAWSLVGRGDWSQPPIEVAKKGKTVVTFGPPLTTKVTVAKRDAKTFNFELAITGQGGETYTAGDIERDGKSLAAPGVKVLDEQGNTVATGKFEYG